jgi:hypothetical protein
MSEILGAYLGYLVNTSYVFRCMDLLSGYAVIHITCLLVYKRLFRKSEGSTVELPLISTLVIRIANYTHRLGSSGKHLLAVFALHLFMA